MDLVDVAVAAAGQAAALIRSTRRPTLAEWQEKSTHDFVTELDRAAEALISEALTRAVPGSVVVGEELSPTAAREGEVVWIVDPLDGTTNYIHGYPQFAVSIGAIVGGVLSVGVVHDVDRNAVYRAGTGQGAWLGDRRISVSPVTDPKHALVGTGFPFKRLDNFERYLRQFTAVTRSTSGIRRAGAAALDLADVAAGRFDAFWELSLAPWDIAAGVVLVREAGGVVTTIEGSDEVLGAASIVSGNPAIHPWLRRLVEAA